MPDLPIQDASCRLGVLAFGDSVTNGGGELQWGVALQSWALWVARGLGLSFTSYAFDGATAAELVNRQIPALLSQNATPAARYRLGCVYIGVNDVRAPEWDPEAYERDLDTALGFLEERAERVLALTAPLDLGRPRTGAGVRRLNAIIEHRARAVGALVLDLSDFGARNRVMSDHVHPTALGQVAIAERALEVLAGAGFEIRARPAALIDPEITWRARLRSDTTLAYRSAKVAGRCARLRLAAGLRPR
ncbi:MAG: GDSL-type esterase/lipase family protein [Actinomycetota bacterium]|nr:GDSL-type esterase/lipase family protein [Actinomycetota bacterium]